jgi:hypothetical protein
MIIWGGVALCGTGLDREFADGASYDLQTRRWRKLAEAPIKERRSHTAIWTGKEMIIWGGATLRRCFTDGASFRHPVR